MTAGQRAAELIAKRAMEQGKKACNLVRELDITLHAFYGWKNGESNPTAYYIGVLAEAGFDIYYIVTGKSKLNFM